MKEIRMKIIACACAWAALASVSSMAVEPAALHAYWSFDEVGEQVANDRSGNGSHATLEDGARIVDTNAVYGGALEIWQAGGRATFDSQDLEALTVSAHLFLDSLETISTDDVIVAPRIIETPGFAVFLSLEGPSLVFEYRYDDFLESKWRLELPDDITGRWWHFAVSFNKYEPATAPAFYIDGARQTEVTMVKMTAGLPVSNEGVGYIGNREDKLRTLNGYIDDLRFYGVELAEEEIVQLGMDCASGFFAAFPAAAPLGNQYYGSWLGFVQPEYYPWLYHYGHGWLYPAGISENGGWFYDDGLGWFHTGPVDPLLIYTIELGWLYYSAESMAPRLFYSYDSGDWISL